MTVGSNNAFAQTRTISGKVVDEHGLPVIGASVMLENDSSTGTVTDLDGKYAVSFTQVGGGEIKLSFSCIGYVTKTIVPGSRTVLDVVLEEDNEILDGTVVIGYGVQKKVT